MRTLVGVRVETDTAIIGFDPFKGNAFEDINSLPDEAVCQAVLDQGFPGVEHVQIYVANEGRPHDLSIGLRRHRPLRPAPRLVRSP